MPDPNNTNTPEQESYQAWIKSQYPEALYDPELTKRLMDIDGQYYNYWVEYVWKPANNFEWDNSSKSYKWPKDMLTPEPAAPLPTGETQSYNNPAPPQAPSHNNSSLPSQMTLNGKDYPLNYVAINYPINERNKNGDLTGHQIYFYAPIIDADNLTPDLMNTLANQIYMVRDDGTKVQDTPLTPIELSNYGISQFNMTNGQLDTTDLENTIISGSLKKWVKDNGLPMNSADIDSYMKTVPDSLKGNIAQLKNNLQNYAVQNASKNTNQTNPQDLMAQYNDAQLRAGQAWGDNEPKTSDFRQQSDYLKAVMDYWKPQYDQNLNSYNQQNESKMIPPDMASQFGYTAVQRYLDAQKQYNAIKSGRAPDIGMGYGEKTPQINEMAQKAKVQTSDYMDTAFRYMQNNDSPEFSTLSIPEKQDLAKAALTAGYQDPGMVAQQQRDEQAAQKAEQQKQYDALLSKARLSQVTPQRQVSL